MPNWCENKLTLEGPQEDRRRFVNGLRLYDDGDPKPSILESYLPMPEPLYAADTSDMRWHRWRLEHWGTSRPDAVYAIHHEADDTVLGFDTAWEPPIEGIRAVSQLFPTLLFRLQWREPGMGLRGQRTFRDGKRGRRTPTEAEGERDEEES